VQREAEPLPRRALLGPARIALDPDYTPSPRQRVERVLDDVLESPGQKHLVPFDLREVGRERKIEAHAGPEAR